MVDRMWVAVEKAVRAGLDDKIVLDDPPQTEEDVMWLAATITDHVVSAFPFEEVEGTLAPPPRRRMWPPFGRRDGGSD